MDEFVATNRAHGDAVTPGHVTSMVRGDDGWWRLPASHLKVPLMFSIAATTSD